MPTGSNTAPPFLPYASSGRRPRIVLVHGTNSDERAWRPTIDLLHQKTADCAGDWQEPATFHWSGKNTHLARRNAGDELVHWILEKFRDVDQPITLVGHSHGGNVCLYATADPRIANRVNRVVTLGTPFISVRRRNLEDVYIPFLLSIGAWAHVIFFATTLFVVSRFDYTSASLIPSLSACTALLVAGVILPMVSLVWGFDGAEFLLAKIIRIQDQEYQKLQNCVNGVPITSFKISKDEAGLGLLVLWFISELPAAIFQFLNVMNNEFLDAGKRYIQKGILRAFVGADLLLYNAFSLTLFVPFGLLFFILVIWPRFARGFGEDKLVTHLLLDVKATEIPQGSQWRDSIAIASGSSLHWRIANALIGLLKCKSLGRKRTIRRESLLRHSAFFTSEELICFLLNTDAEVVEPSHPKANEVIPMSSVERNARRCGVALFYGMVCWPAIAAFCTLAVRCATEH